MKIFRPRTLLLIAAISSLFLSTFAFAKIEKKTETFTPPPTKEMVFQHWGNKTGNFTGTLDFLEDYRANIIDSRTKENLRVPLFYFSPPDLCYFLSQLAIRDFPKEMTHWKFSADEKSKNMLIDINTDNLPLGPLMKVKNSGSLGGNFVKTNVAPVVKELYGRKGIFFTTNKGQYIKPKFQMLTSDFTLENRLDQKQPFTASAWFYSLEGIGAEGGDSILSWHSFGGDHGTSLNYGLECDIGGLSLTSRGKKGEGKGATGAGPVDRWQHVTYTYTGGEDGIFRVYVDGEKTYEAQYDNIVEKEDVLDITATSATIKAKLKSKTGKATVSFYIGDFDHKHWFQMRHWQWDQTGTIEWAEAGEVKWTFDNLKPNTKYFYRIMSIDHHKGHWSYELNPSRRWMYGPGEFVTASADGKTPGKIIPEDKRKHFFVGGKWGSSWYMAAQGPSVDAFFDGGIADLKVYDYAMGPMEVRLNAGLTAASNASPANGARLMEMFATPSWSPAHPKTAQYAVYRSTNKADVESRTAKATRTKEAKLPRMELDYGRTYYWAVDQLDARGHRVAKGDVWSFTAENGTARQPDPKVGDSVNNIYDLRWTPGPVSDVAYQNFYMAESKEQLAKMTAPTRKIQNSRWAAGNSVSLTGTETVPGKTYYWKVDTAYETREPGTEPIDKNRPERGMKPGKLISTYISHGDVWSFKVKPYFTPESDLVSQEPNADEQEKASRGAKLLELEVGHPGVTSPGAKQESLFQKVVGTSSMIGKSKRLMDYFDAVQAASVLGSHEGNGAKFFGGWTGYSYGNAETSDILLVHETGHQVFGHLGHAIPGYYQRIEKIWLGTADTNVGLGGYNANNVHENMAVFLQQFGNASARERMYEMNYKQAVAIAEYLPGEMVISLDANQNITVDSQGTVTRWGNNGWLRTWDNATVSYVPIKDTVGDFLPFGQPTLTTVGGVAAVSFDGTSAFKWDKNIQWNMSRNLPFAIEYWVYQPKGSSDAGDQLIAGWGEKGKGGTGFYLNADGTIYDHGGRKTGKLELARGTWNHVVQLYKGAGPTGGIDKGTGEYVVYLNGEVAHKGTMAFSVPQHQSIYIGGRVDKNGTVSEGLRGAIASVKIYDYDLSDYQAKHFYQKQLANFGRENLNVAEKLYVDLDSRLLADTQQGYHRPTYSAKMRKPWLRSWSNKGVLPGRIHNDTHTAMWGYSGSTPVLKTKMGVKMPTFDGMDRMVSSYQPSQEMLANPAGSIEIWLDNQAESDDEVILQWGHFVLTTQGLPTGQQTVTVVFGELPDTFTGPLPKPNPKRKMNKKKLARWNQEQEKIRQRQLVQAIKKVDSAVYVNGKKIDKKVSILMPAYGERMHLGGRYDPIRWNWKNYFNGSIAAVRIHKGRLTENAIVANAKKHPFAAGGKGVIAPKRQTPKPVIALNAAGLRDGKLAKWKSTGTAKVDFVPGSRGSIFGLEGMVFKDVPAVKMTPGRELTATFDTPDALKKGPFTLQFRIVDMVSQKNAPQILAWGKGSAKFNYGVRMRRDMGAFEVRGSGNKNNRNRAKKAASLARDKDEKNYFNNHMAYFWKTVSIVYDGQDLKYYVNGKMTNSVPFEGLNITNDGKLILGSTSNVDNYVFLHSLKIFGRAFSAKELVKADKSGYGDKEALVHVVVKKAEEGTLNTTLKNTGSLQGAFSTAVDPDHTADVAKVGGLEAVKFDGNLAFMVSAENTPATLTGNHAFTVEMFIHPSRLNNEESVFALAPDHRNTDCQTYFSSPGNLGILSGNRRRLRYKSQDSTIKPNTWIHVTYVYDGGRRSKIRFYVNGKLNTELAYRSLATLPGRPMYLGSSFSSAKGEQNLFAGAIRSLTVYDYPRTDAEIQAAAKASLAKAPQGK